MIDVYEATKMFPKELLEWKRWAERLDTGSLYYAEEFRAAANAMSEHTFEELVEFYVRAAKEKHIERINAWLKEEGGHIPMEKIENELRHLFVLFAYIAVAWGRRPFTSQELDSSKLIPAIPDWSKLPEDMRFLGEPAEEYWKFQYVFSDEGQEYVRNNVTPQEIAQLSLVAEQIRRVGYGNIKAWWKQLGSWGHIESSMLFNLTGVLNALELPYCGHGDT